LTAYQPRRFCTAKS